MGQKINPGIIVSVTNQKGGVGKSTITMLLADYLHIKGTELGLRIGVVDCDDLQNSLIRKRERETEGLNEEEMKDFYQIMNIPSKDFADHVEVLQQVYDIIFVDLPGNMKQDGVMTIYYLIDVAFIPTEASELDIDSTNLFFNQYKEIIQKRKELGFQTSVFGMFNKVNNNLIEFKELYNNRNQLAFPFLDNYIKESKVRFQRNISTLETKFDYNADKTCEEMLQKIVEHQTSK